MEAPAKLPFASLQVQNVTGVDFPTGSMTTEQDTFPKAIFTITLTLIFPLIYFFIKNSKQSSKGNDPLPPGPQGLPIIGYLPFLGAQLHKEFTKLAEIYGPIYKLQLGNKLCMVISSPSLAKQIMRDQDAIFANRDPPIAVKATTYGGVDIAWSSCTPEWKKARKVFVREMMSNANLNACYGLRSREVYMAIKGVYKNVGIPVNISELIFLMNMNATMSMLWGATLEGNGGGEFGIKFKELVAEHMILVGKPNISDYFPLLSMFDLSGIERRTKKFLVAIEEVLDLAIERHRALIQTSKAGKEGRSEKRKDLLSHLLKLRDSGDGEMSITTNQLKAMLTDTVIGGSDTTSTMVEWTIAELMNNQKIMEKVQQELDEVVGLTNVVEESHLPKLHYLDAVVKETFRLHPALPFLIPRCPSATATIGEYTIPKGTTVFINVYSIHRDPQIWKNPLEFQPERFFNGGATKLDFSGNNFKYIPFGSGRRICAGLPLAERMLVYQLASLLHSFDWKLPTDSKLDLSDTFGLVVKMKEPLLAIPTPRLSNVDLY